MAKSIRQMTTRLRESDAAKLTKLRELYGADSDSSVMRKLIADAYFVSKISTSIDDKYLAAVRRIIDAGVGDYVLTKCAMGLANPVGEQLLKIERDRSISDAGLAWVAGNIANNLNQIAHALNTAKRNGSLDDFAYLDLRESLQKIASLAQRLEAQT
ncbi:plasmid mobilization relaxosome protein MobC [uncultured Lacticaseibacillus sp.]|uniref:plasmid mobilization relaxosome protein MobC n=1 Tax=uncultured Lacticaseibacillus sp. TaxID=2775882 RepID=UPI0025918BB9|nr:plasmid mobilization relaxosome protein MobC [uncultured Lacticaseibacillus sp.]